MGCLSGRALLQEVGGDIKDRTFRERSWEMDCWEKILTLTFVYLTLQLIIFCRITIEKHAVVSYSNSLSKLVSKTLHYCYNYFNKRWLKRFVKNIVQFSS